MARHRSHSIDFKRQIVFQPTPCEISGRDDAVRTNVGVPISPKRRPPAKEASLSRETMCDVKEDSTPMDISVETKDDFIAAASDGFPRVVEAIIATPAEARIGVINAVVESYRKLAGDFLTEEETEKWLVDVVARLKAEVSAKEQPEKKTSSMDAASLVPEAGIVI
jgi:hypothetical protein